MRRGIILSGGTGSRLFPITISVNKQLLPVYDKPLIYYPLSTVMQAGVREILIIVNSELSESLFKNLLGDGSQFGIKLSYKIQKEPKGIAEAFIIGEEFLDGNEVILALGDNIFYSSVLENFLKVTPKLRQNYIFGCKVKNPSSYGVATVGEHNFVTDIWEKPINPVSNLAVPGLYLYDNTIVERAKKLKPSARGELEITDLSKDYINNYTDHSFKKDKLRLFELEHTFWFDAGTHDSLLEASQFVKAAQTRTGEKIGDPTTVAKQNGWI